MKNKHILFLLLCFLLFPFAILSTSFTTIEGDSLFYNSNKVSLENEDFIQAENQLINSRWKYPMESEIIQSKLIEYEDKALLSFFSFEDRNAFQELVKQIGIKVEKIYNPIPAITISYNQEQISNVDFSDFKVKYVYPIGTNSYFVPQNIDMELSGKIDMKEIREALEIDAIHNQGYTGYGMKIAVLDSGMNISQAPSLSTLRRNSNLKVIYSLNFVPIEDSNDRSGHGTHIASILAGNGDFIINDEVERTLNYGIAPDAQLFNIKVLDETGFGEDEWLIDGFAHAIDEDADVISASLTSITFSKIGDPVEELMYEAGRRGIPVVASAGNKGPTSSSVGAPALWDYVLSIGATKNLQDLEIYSSRGLNRNFTSAVDLLAPGSSVGGSDAADGGLKYVSGTSVAVPIVSGVLALLMEAFPDFNIHEFEAALLETAVDLNHPVHVQGNGLIDPLAAFEYLENNEHNDIFTLNPKRISSANLIHYTCVEGENKEFNIKVISSMDQTLNTSVTGDSEFIVIPAQVGVTKGWNKFVFNISIPMGTPIRDIDASIRLFNVNGTSSTISIKIQTRFYGGTILFDIAHENDTKNQWFDASSPLGTHSHIARRLKDQGFHLLYHFEGNLTLDNVDILVISDPELSYSVEDLNKIYNFVDNGGSLLFLINSIRLIDSGDIENEPLISSNYETCNDILGLFDASVGSQLDIEYIPYEAFTTQEADMISVDSFFFWGWPVGFYSNSTNPANKVLARFNTMFNGEEVRFNAALATEIGDGRVMIFGSGYPFTDIGLLPDTYEKNPTRAELNSSFIDLFNIDNKNNQLVNDTFDWLISTRRPNYEVVIEPQKPFIREQFKVGVYITDKNDAIYVSGNGKLNGTIIYANQTIDKIELILNAQNQRYECQLIFENYGWHSLYIPLKLVNHTAYPGRIDIFSYVKLWTELPLIKNISAGLTVFILITIIMTPSIRYRFRRIVPKE